MTVEERTPLLHDQSPTDSDDGAPNEDKTPEIKLKKHITLWTAVLLIIGSVVGSGIFVSPKGVTQNVNSVGASLIIWTVTGFINLAQALCYAELGGMIPMAGGDYAYLFYILGPLPAFLCAWIHILIISASACATISRTAAVYLVDPLLLDCRNDLIVIIAVLIIISLCSINAVSAVWGTRVHILFTIAKTISLLIVIITGIVLLIQGHTKNFERSFEGTNTDPGAIGLAVLDGYFAYKGWELINALPEEMVNPTRDLQPAAVIGMLSITAIYVLTNVAYFAVLSPEELISSDAVALTFADSALGGFAVVMPFAVALSCMGAVNGDFLANSRYIFAGGRFNQVPKFFSFIHMRFLTPFLSVIMIGALALLYCVFKDLQTLQEYSALAVQLKTVLALIALFYYRWKRPEIPRPFKVNLLVAVLTFLVTLGIVVLSFYKSPVTTSIGIGVMIVGIPVYYLGRCCLHCHSANSCMDKTTKVIQKIFLIVPESKSKVDDIVIEQHID